MAKPKITNTDVLRNFRFDFIEMGITSLMADLSKKFKMYSDTFPVYMFNTGDELYMLNWQGNKAVKEFKNASDLYQINPRLELSPKPVSIDTQQLTNPYCQGLFNVLIDGKEYNFRSYVKRIPINIQLEAQLTCDNYLLSTKYTELLLTMLYRLNSFDFFSNKRRHTGSYQISDSIDGSQFNMSHDSERRNKVLGFTVSLDLQFPAFDLFKENGVTNAEKTIGDAVNNIYIESGVENDNGFTDETTDKVVEDSTDRGQGGDGTIPENGYNTEDGNLTHAGSVSAGDWSGESDELVGGVEHPIATNQLKPIHPKEERGIVEYNGVYYEWPE